MVIYIVQILFCFLIFMLNDSSFSSLVRLWIWKYKDLIKIVDVTKCRRWNKCLWTREKVFNFAIIRIQISFSNFQLPPMSDSSLFSSEASLSSSESLDSFSNFDKHNHTEAVAWRCSVKKMFLQNSQNSQENVCARVSFLIKLHASDLQVFVKKRL